MINEEPVQQFEVDTEQAEHVAIYPNDDPDGPHFYAVPFVHKDTFEDGTLWLHEPDNFTVTDAYREAVANHADVDISEIKLTREFEIHGPI